jgi:hypothetical protein
MVVQEEQTLEVVAVVLEMDTLVVQVGLVLLLFVMLVHKKVLVEQ